MGRADLTGQRFGRLIAINCVGTDKWHRSLWHCKCDCGKEVTANCGNLNRGAVRSCGCLKGGYVTHGDSKTRLYSIYHGIIRRTEDSKRKEYKDYGGRGIRMCGEWRTSYEAFREWAHANGYNDSLSIDRIDNDGDYSPSNCRWSGRNEQANNRNDTVYLTKDGVRKSVSDWARETGVPYAKLKKRVRLGWSDERVLCAQ